MRLLRRKRKLRKKMIWYLNKPGYKYSYYWKRKVAYLFTHRHKSHLWSIQRSSVMGVHLLQEQLGELNYFWPSTLAKVTNFYFICSFYRVSHNSVPAFVLSISQPPLQLQIKFYSFWNCPVRAGFQNVQDYISRCFIRRDIYKTAIASQNKNQHFLMKDDCCFQI